MKSMLSVSYCVSRMESSWSSPTGECCQGFIWRQRSQVLIYWLMYLDIWGYQQFWDTSSSIFQYLGCPVIQMSWQRATICLRRSRLCGMYIFPWNWSRLFMFDHSKEYTASLGKPQSSCAALAMGFSWSLFLFPLQMSDRIFCSMPVSSIPSRARTAKNSSQRRTMFLLSEAPFL